MKENAIKIKLNGYRRWSGSAPFSRWRSLTFWFAFPPTGGPGMERRNMILNANQGHIVYIQCF